MRSLNGLVARAIVVAAVITQGMFAYESQARAAVPAKVYVYCNLFITGNSGQDWRYYTSQVLAIVPEYGDNYPSVPGSKFVRNWEAYLRSQGIDVDFAASANGGSNVPMCFANTTVDATVRSRSINLNQVRQAGGYTIFELTWAP